MERQIKFRAWDNQAKKMSSTFNPLEGEKPTIYGEAIYSSDAVYMQFAGLQDINGKDIYDGDIAREWLVDTVEPEGGFWNYYEIKFEKGCFVCKEIGFTYENEEPTNLHKCANEIAIIGNIYENPELLNSQK